MGMLGLILAGHRLWPVVRLCSMAREARVFCDSSSHARDECRKILELAVELPVLESPVIHLLAVRDI